MTTQRFTSGAFAFTRVRGVQPRPPSDLQRLAASHGLAADIVPEYPGDRATIGRAFTLAKSGLGKDGLLLRPIKRSATELVYGVVKERADVVDQRLEHEFEAVVRWSSEPDAGQVHGDHPVAQRVGETYRSLRGTVTADDWSSTIASFLESHDAARVRSDGRIYWVPPQRVDAVRKLAAFLSEVGIDLILCELEPEVRQVVQSVAKDNLDDQISRLQAEVAAFDGKQKPSTYARRLDEFQRLRERAVLYRDALGLGVDRAHAVLAELERKVTEMFELRSATVIHRDGQAADVCPFGGGVPDGPAPGFVLRFAGAEFTCKSSADDDEVRADAQRL